MKRLIILAVLFISFTSFAQQRIKSFDAYWPSFRAAVMAYNVTALDSLVSYPLTVRGMMDYDPFKKINRDKIVSTLKTALSQDGHLDDENFPDETNMQEIKRKVTIPDKNYKFSHQGDIYMSVANLDFKKIRGKWKLETIYIDMVK
jgi:hypothetical protein